MFRTRKLSAGSITFNLNNFFIALTILVNLGACAHAQEVKHVTDSTKNSVELRNLSQDEWKKRLDPEVYQVTRCSATEMPFTGKYWNNHDKGTYLCSNCGKPLFDSSDKYDSGTGWPSFSKTKGEAVDTKKDISLGMVREEVICKNCGAHLGHLFNDGPTPTGERFCINSASLDFKKSASTNTDSKNK